MLGEEFYNIHMTIICCCKDWSPAVLCWYVLIGTASIDHPAIPHVSYKANGEGLPAMDSFTEASYFTGAFPTLFPYGVGGRLGDTSGNRLKRSHSKTLLNTQC
jgi:hypothetical protein